MPKLIFALLLVSFVVTGPGAHAEAAPANDNRANAKEITALPWNDADYVGSGSVETNEPTQCIPSTTPLDDQWASAWESYTPAKSGLLTALVWRQGAGNALAIWTARSGTDELVACVQAGGQNDDYSPATFYARAGATYYFQILATNSPYWPATYFSLEQSRTADLAIENLRVARVVYHTDAGDVTSPSAFDISFDVNNYGPEWSGFGAKWVLAACGGNRIDHCSTIDQSESFWITMPGSGHRTARWNANTVGDITICAFAQTLSRRDPLGNNVATAPVWVGIGNAGGIYNVASDTACTPQPPAEG